jgi:hypothetical protein
MKTLTKKNAATIATLYNTIFVWESFCRESIAKFDEGCTNEETVEEYKRYRKNCVDAADTLQKEFGIVVIGYY